jgi:hypothetical protein
MMAGDVNAEVADSTLTPSLQPPAPGGSLQHRLRVTERVWRALNESEEIEGHAVAFTHRGLACRVYNTEEPTPAQLSAVRRASARLVAEGDAERWTERAWSWHPPWMDNGPGRPRHKRGRYDYANPGGVILSRVGGR